MEFPDLEKQFQDILETVGPREAAEAAYALAMRYKRAGEKDQAVRWGQKAIELLDKCPMVSMSDCAHRHTELFDVPIPDLFHQEVVRRNLEPFKL
jgi:tetratricopeptide (TPR) repeat protein